LTQNYSIEPKKEGYQVTNTILNTSIEATEENVYKHLEDLWNVIGKVGEDISEGAKKGNYEGLENIKKQLYTYVSGKSKDQENP